MPELYAASARLAGLLKECSPLGLAFSGGLDSRFLAYAAQKLLPKNGRIHLYFFHGPHTGSAELAGAAAWAEKRNLPLSVLPLNPLDFPEVRANSKERCYHCKLALFTTLKRHLAANPPFPGLRATVCDGSNASDAKGFRPGLRALQELSVRSPLAEAGLGKEDIRRLAANWGMDRPDQQARPCLLTRFGYGLAPDPAALAALDKAEQRIQALLEEAASSGAIPLPWPEFRLRLVGLSPGRAQAADTGETAHFQNTAINKSLSCFAVELHLVVSFIPEALAASLCGAVMEQGFARPGLIRTDRISGLYDRQPGLTFL